MTPSCGENVFPSSKFSAVWAVWFLVVTEAFITYQAHPSCSLNSCQVLTQHNKTYGMDVGCVRGSAFSNSGITRWPIALQCIKKSLHWIYKYYYDITMTFIVFIAFSFLASLSWLAIFVLQRIPGLTESLMKTAFSKQYRKEREVSKEVFNLLTLLWMNNVKVPLREDAPWGRCCWGVFFIMQKASSNSLQWLLCHKGGAEAALAASCSLHGFCINY